MGYSRILIAITVIGLSVVFPATICGALAWLPFTSAMDLLAMSAAAACWMGLIVLLNWWGFTSIWLRWIWVSVLVLVVAARLSGPGAFDLHLGSMTIGALVALTLGLWLLVPPVSARRPGADVIALGFPLADGVYLVGDGGDGATSFLVNYHYGFGRHRAAGVSRSMRFATDIVKIGGLGGESRGFLPRRNSAFWIWNEPLLAPCDGRVVHTTNDVVDNAAFGAHRPYGVGNHVVIQHGQDYVVLGHLRAGSVSVKAGENVRTGQLIGRVGNSGWTERPHVHIQAMRSADADWWHGEPLAMLFAGRFPVRNNLIRVGHRPPELFAELR